MYGATRSFEADERHRERTLRDARETGESGRETAGETADTVGFEGSERTEGIEKALERL